MLATLKYMSPRGRRTLARWTAFGTLGCILFAQTANWLMFHELGQPALGLSIFSGTIIPILLAGPLFFYLTLKLRELAIANHRLMTAATTDSLTGCLNRGAFAAHVEATLAAARETDGGGFGALMVIDADQFKRINDRFGHGNGDEALRLMASAIRSAIRSQDVVGRLGGEEFGVFLAGPCEAEAIANRIRRAVEAARFRPNGTSWSLTASIGCVFFDVPTPFSELYRVADDLLYQAKRSGRNRVVIAAADTAVQAAPNVAVG